MKRVLAALILLILPGTALAMEGEFMSVNWALGIAMSAIGALICAYVAGLQSRITAVNAELSRRIDTNTANIGLLFSKTQDLRSDLLMNYHPKPEIRELVQYAATAAVYPIVTKLEVKVDALHTRLDMRGFPKVGHDE